MIQNRWIKDCIYKFFPRKHFSHYWYKCPVQLKNNTIPYSYFTEHDEAMDPNICDFKSGT